MKAKDLSLRGQTACAYCIEGEDPYWRRYALAQLRAAYVQDACGEVGVDSLKDLDAFADACNTYSFFGPGLVVVRDDQYQERAGDSARMLAVLQGCENVVAFVGVPLPRAVKGACVVVDCSRLAKGEAAAYLTSAYPRLPMQCALLIAEYTGRDMDRMVTEAQKLCAYAQGEPITEQTVKELVPDTVENQIYELTDALATNKRAVAMQILDRFLSVGTSSYYLLSALTRQYRRMFYAGAGELSTEELAQLTGGKEYSFIKARDAARAYSKRRLKANLDVLTRAEFAFKNGVMSEESALQWALTKLLV